jgi:hypothetical protein
MKRITHDLTSDSLLTCGRKQARLRPQFNGSKADTPHPPNGHKGVSMRFLPKAAMKAGVIAEVLTFFGSNKRWWLLPMLITLFFFGVLIVVAQSSVVAPFIYTLF